MSETAGNTSGSTDERSVAALAAYREVVRTLNDLDTAALDFEMLEPAELDELVTAQVRAATKIEAAAARSLGAWHGHRTWLADGARSGAAWLARHTTLSRRGAADRLKIAQQSADMPATLTAFESGELSLDQTRKVAKLARDEKTKQAFERGEKYLVDQLVAEPADDTQRVIDSWRNRQAAEAAAKTDAQRRRRRDVRTWTNDHGNTMVLAELHPEAGAVFTTALGRLVDSDWRSTHTTSPDGSEPPPDDRTLGQRRADALIAMADRATSTIGREAEYPAPVPQLLVNVDYESLVSQAGRADELGARVPLTGEAARRLACDAGISRHITKGRSVTLDKGRTVRVATPAQREAIHARDGGCTFPTCDAPVSWVRIHHVIPWQMNGETNPDDLTSVCDHDHHLAHEGGWTCTPFDHEAGHQWWISPTGKRFPANHRGREPDPTTAPPRPSSASPSSPTRVDAPPEVRSGPRDPRQLALSSAP